MATAMEEKKKKPYEFNKKKHVAFLKQFYNMIPHHYEGQDSNRGTLLYFIISSLDLLGAIDEIDKKNGIEYLYSLQILPDESKGEPEKYFNCGFRGSGFLGLPWNSSNTPPKETHCLDQAHLALTYTVLCGLRILGDDYSRVYKKAIISALKNLQMENGAFVPVNGGGESDVRYIYCAVAISYLLEDFSGINIDKSVQYILQGQSYDYGYGQGVGQESHGGSTYCALASLALLNKLERVRHRKRLIQWLLERQVSGFQGRTNKDPDTCYSFWIGSSLNILDSIHLVNAPLCKGFTYSCESKYGGFGKTPDAYPDLLHSYFALCGLSMLGEPGLLELDYPLGMTVRAAANLSIVKQKNKKN